MDEKTVVYVCPLEGYIDAQYEQHFALLPKWRQEKVLKLRSKEKQKESTLAFTLLSYALKKDFEIEDFMFIYNEYQKPYLADKAVFFSLSHCSEAVAVGVSVHEIGVDAERISKVRPKAAERIFSAHELALISAGANPKLTFTRLWTEKEAIAKLKGNGLLKSAEEEKTEAYALCGLEFPTFYVSACTENSALNVSFIKILPSEI